MTLDDVDEERHARTVERRPLDLEHARVRSGHGRHALLPRIPDAGLLKVPLEAIHRAGAGVEHADPVIPADHLRRGQQVRRRAGAHRGPPGSGGARAHDDEHDDEKCESESPPRPSIEGGSHGWFSMC